MLTHPQLPNLVAVLHNLVASLSGGRVAVEEALPTAPTAEENDEDAEARPTPPLPPQGQRTADGKEETHGPQGAERQNGEGEPEQRGEQ